QLGNAGLSEYFTKIMSVESVGKFKPTQDVYDFAAKTLSETPEHLWLIAAHDWDIAGAMHAGWQGAFVARPGMVIAPQATPPQIIGDDLAQVAEQLIATLR
ncbi:MAG: HAD hydrolase-like protein, partial [Aggregatilineales bacterium]